MAIGIIYREREILIARRKADDTLGGFWEFPGGKVERGETLQAALLRELSEELDLTCVIGDPLPPFEHCYPQSIVQLHPFLATPAGGIAKPLDSDEIRWVAVEDLVNYQFPPANADLIAHVQRKFGAA